MLFVVHWQFKPEKRDEVRKRFEEIGISTPEGVKMIGSWHSISQDEGWAVAEADDAVQLGKCAYSWTDLNIMHITPVVDNTDMMKIAGMHESVICS